MPAALACTVPATRQKDLDRSDLIVVGKLHVIEEKTEDRSPHDVTYRGVVEVIPTKVIRNRARIDAPFRFEYEQIDDKDNGCIFGTRPEDGSAATIYLNRAKDGKSLYIVHIDYTPISASIN